jgi:adenine phosphoribosyltransferase
MDELKKAIREIPDFPKKGILFYDITTMLKDPKAFKQSIDVLASKLEGKDYDAILGVESRGFIFASALAYKLGKGLIVVRKPGKLPAETIQATYELEYGTDTIEMHADAVRSGQKVVIVDDLLATGGTAQATAELVEKAGGKVEAILFLVELDFLNGRDKLSGHETVSILNYAS